MASQKLFQACRTPFLMWYNCGLLGKDSNKQRLVELQKQMTPSFICSRRLCWTLSTRQVHFRREGYQDTQRCLCLLGPFIHTLIDGSPPSSSSYHNVNKSSTQQVQLLEFPLRERDWNIYLPLPLILIFGYWFSFQLVQQEQVCQPHFPLGGATWLVVCNGLWLWISQVETQKRQAPPSSCLSPCQDSQQGLMTGRAAASALTVEFQRGGWMPPTVDLSE